MLASIIFLKRRLLGLNLPHPNIPWSSSSSKFFIINKLLVTVIAIEIVF
jgi:hypothetical protein